MLTAVATTGEKLRRLRLGRAWTQEQVAANSGVAQSTIAQIEKGHRPNSHPSTLGKLAEALNCRRRSSSRTRDGAQR